MKMEAIASTTQLNEAISTEDNDQVKAVLKVALNQLIALK
jgi:hypothetical protein